MSVAGFDIGDQSSCIAVARKRGIDVLMNKESKRETPSLVAFGQKQRQLGTDAVGSLSLNPRNTISQIKRLLGKKFSCPDVQRDITLLPYEVTEAPDGGCQIHVDYLNARTTFTPEQIFAMLLVDQKNIAEADGSPVTDCVIGVPTYFTEAERLATLNAAQIAGVTCLRLFNDTTATALSYGIYKVDLPETDPVNVVFIDAGHSALQVTIVAFKKGQLKVLAHAFDRNVGGRDFDEVLFDHFAKEFGTAHKTDIKANPKASFRLRLACEKLKKVLSANAESPISVESLLPDIDVRSSMTRELFEEMSKPILARATQPLQQALTDAKLSLGDIASVEVIGGSSRVPALQAIIRDFFGKEPGRTLNAKECVSRGAALNCAMLSPIFRVRDYEVVDAYPFGVSFKWDKDGEIVTSEVFERNGLIPRAKMLTFFRNTAFTLEASYTEDSPIPEGFDRTIGVFTVGPPLPAEGLMGDKAKLKVRLALNLHGITSVESVQQIDEEEYEETVKKQPAAPVDVKMADPADTDEKMEDAPAAGEAAPAEAKDDAVPMETEAAPGPAAPAAEETEIVKKKRTKRTDIPFRSTTVGLKPPQVQSFVEKEFELAMQSRVQEETNDRKNALEAYIYSLRGRLSDELVPFVTDADRSALAAKLEEHEDWLYDEGEDTSKGVYISKLEGLQKLGEPIVLRAAESHTRGPAAAALTAAANHYINAASVQDSRTAHISDEDKAKVVTEGQKALSWLAEKQTLQSGLKKWEDPVLLTADIKKKEDTVVRFCDPILSKPPPKKEEPKPEPKKEEAKPEAAAEPVVTEPTDPEPMQAE